MNNLDFYSVDVKVKPKRYVAFHTEVCTFMRFNPVSYNE